MALTKNDILEQIKNQLGFPKNQSKDITETLLEIMNSAMESGDDVLVSNLHRAYLSESKLKDARIVQTTLSKAIIVNADLTEANLKEGYLYSANLTGANLFKTDLSGVNLYKAILVETKCKESNVSNAFLY